MEREQATDTHDPAATGVSSRGRRIAAVSVPVVATLLAHGAVVANGFVLPRDSHWLLDHDGWHGFGDGRFSWMLETARGGMARPLAWISLATDAALTGSSGAATVHTGSVVLQALGALLLALLFVRVLTREGAAARDPRAVHIAAALAAAAWAVHPLRVEAVAWASARGELLATTLGIASAVALERGVGSSVLRPLSVLGSVALATAAVLADPGAVGLPVALVALALWLRVDRPRSVASWATGPALATASAAYLVPIGVGLTAALATRSAGNPGIPAPALAVAAASGVMRALRATLLPIGLAPAYSPPPGFPDELDASLLLDAGLTLVLAVVTLWGLRRLSGSALVGLAFLGVLVPQILIGHDPVGADRYAGLATAGLFLGAVNVALDRLGGVTARRAAAAAGGALILVLGLLSARQVTHWRDDATLTAHTLAVDPANETALVARGEHVRRAGGEWSEWLPFDRRAVEAGGVRPLAEWWYGRGLLEVGDAAAETHLRRAVDFGPWLPGPLHDLGVLLLRRGEKDAAAGLLRRAARLDDRSASIWFALGRAELLCEDRPAAVRALRRAAELAPEEAVILDALERAEAQ